MTEVKHKLETIVLIPTRVKAMKQDGLGWYAQFEGSWESILVGDQKPENLNVGDSVFIAIQKPKEIR